MNTLEYASFLFSLQDRVPRVESSIKYEQVEMLLLVQMLYLQIRTCRRNAILLAVATFFFCIGSTIKNCNCVVQLLDEEVYRFIYVVACTSYSYRLLSPSHTFLLTKRFLITIKIVLLVVQVTGDQHYARTLFTRKEIHTI